MEQDQAAQSAIAKAASRLFPFLCLCYAVNFERVNVGFAPQPGPRLHALNLWGGRRHLLHRLSPAGADARYGRHLCHRQHLLVAVDSDPDWNGGRGALVNSIDNLGGLAGPSIVGVIKQATDSFTAALLFLAGAMALGGVIAVLFGRTARAGASRPRNSPRRRVTTVLWDQATRAGVRLRFASLLAPGLPLLSCAPPVAPH